MGRLILPADHNRFDEAFQCAGVHLASHGLTWLHLKAQGIQESLLDPRAVSPTGPRGIMQFTKATGKEWGLITEEDFFDPVKSIDAGARYMAYLLTMLAAGTTIVGRKIRPVPDTFERWQMALAAYNQGIGNLSKVVESAHRSRIDATDWACVAHEYAPPRLPGPRCKEVLNYVARIKKYYAILKVEPTPPAAARAVAA